MSEQFTPDAEIRPGNHWLATRDASGWGCDGCDWTSDKAEDFWKSHERRDDDILF